MGVALLPLGALGMNERASHTHCRRPADALGRAAHGDQSRPALSLTALRGCRMPPRRSQRGFLSPSSPPSRDSLGSLAGVLRRELDKRNLAMSGGEADDDQANDDWTDGH